MCICIIQNTRKGEARLARSPGGHNGLCGGRGMSLVPAVPVAASGNALDDAPDRLNELHRRAAAVLTHPEAGITCPKDALLFVDELIYKTAGGE